MPTKRVQLTACVYTTTVRGRNSSSSTSTAPRSRSDAPDPTVPSHDPAPSAPRFKVPSLRLAGRWISGAFGPRRASPETVQRVLDKDV